MSEQKVFIFLQCKKQIVLGLALRANVLQLVIIFKPIWLFPKQFRMLVMFWFLLFILEIIIRRRCMCSFFDSDASYFLHELRIHLVHVGEIAYIIHDLFQLVLEALFILDSDVFIHFTRLRFQSLKFCSERCHKTTPTNNTLRSSLKSLSLFFLHELHLVLIKVPIRGLGSYRQIWNNFLRFVSLTVSISKPFFPVGEIFPLILNVFEHKNLALILVEPVPYVFKRTACLIVWLLALELITNSYSHLPHKRLVVGHRVVISG